ncbi:hypothetical protein HBA12_14250 [Tenacibaculum mesophilum]|uniref:hypothetical protein n=1 Tax=Tenacibaculum mesophilum TaxID=104268 RepID=UPI00143048A4|nr:hypothetical protein [Tenacibaculum mesophilum]KAF9658346.1 hypothetical protein HBA12_14250 [Tenacibaculum mesophilum]
MNTQTDWISAISSALTTIISGGVLWVAYYQIKQVKVQVKGLAENQKNSTLMAVLELESELNKRKESFDKANFELREYNLELESSKKKLNKDLLEIYSDKIEVSKENYLNSLDRLSYCILHNYLSDRDWRTEYRDTIFEAVDSYKEKYDISSRYRNTIDIYNKWKSE